VSRVKAVLRRTGATRPSRTLLKVGDLSIDVEKHLVFRGEVPIELTPTEFELLRVLAEHPGRVYTRMQLLDKVQGDAFEGYERTIDSHVKNLRRKVEPDPEHPSHIITVHGVGYKVQETGNA
jgi:DNA-binding response OmpR family regulator